MTTADWRSRSGGLFLVAGQPQVLKAFPGGLPSLVGRVWLCRRGAWPPLHSDLFFVFCFSFLGGHMEKKIVIFLKIGFIPELLLCFNFPLYFFLLFVLFFGSFC